MKHKHYSINIIDSAFGSFQDYIQCKQHLQHSVAQYQRFHLITILNNSALGLIFTQLCDVT